MFSALIEAIQLVIYLYIIAIFIYSISSYFPGVRNSKLGYYLTRLCEPLLTVFRFATIGSISFAPMLATFFLLLLIQVLEIIY